MTIVFTLVNTIVTNNLMYTNVQTIVLTFVYTFVNTIVTSN